MDRTAILQAGFAPIRRSPRRLIANIQSARKSVGKTRLSFTAPKPIGYISVEIGGEEGAADAFIPEGQEEFDGIHIVRIRMDEPVYPNPADYGTTKEGQKDFDEAVSAAVQAAAQPAWDAFYAAYYASIYNMRSTVVDTGTDLYQLQRLANFGRLEKIPQLAYAQLKREFAKLFDDAFAAPGNLLFIHHMKDKGEMIEDKNGKKQWQPTGIYEMDGCNVVTDKVQAVIEMWRDSLQEPDEKTGRLVKFHATIVDSRHSPDVMGQEFHDDEISFPQIAMSIIGGSRASDWE